VSGIVGILVAIFGPPNAVLIWFLVVILTALSQISGIVGDFPRTVRWAANFYGRVIAVLEVAHEWIKKRGDQIDRIWRDPWDGD
jgi:hypothetical protein